jgi:predicted Zn-dependent protease
MNIQRRVRWKILAFIFACILIPHTALGISIKEEEELSREVLEIIRKRFKIIEDPIVVRYIDRLGKKMVEVLPPQPFTYHFYVIEEQVFNAFATPAGHIFINSGLIEALQNENELAGVLGHEIAHVANRHISKKIEHSKKVQLATLAGMAAGALLGVGGAGAAAQGVTMGSMAAGQSVLLAYSRDDELEADETGLDILSRSGFGGEGLLSSLKIIRGKQWFGSEQIPTYLSTHPASEERIVNLGNWIETRGEKARATGGFDKENFSLVQTRLISLYGEEILALNRFEALVKDHPEDPMNQYGYGLIQARLGNRESAIAHLKKALEKRAFDPYILTDLGRVYFLDGRFSDALKTLEGAVSIEPAYPEALLHLARTHTENGDYAKAASLLETLIEKSPGYKMAYYALGEAYGKQHKDGESHFYLGLFYWYRQDPKNAEFHLNRASKLISDEAKMKQIDEILGKVRKENSKQGDPAHRPG